MDALKDKKSARDRGKTYAFVKKINPGLKMNARPDILGKNGGFSGLFETCLSQI